LQQEGNMSHQQRRPSDVKYGQQRRAKGLDSDELQSVQAHVPFGLSASNLLGLQHTIGNQAVQRLIQRAPGDSPKKSEPQKQEELPGFVASITGTRHGKFQSKSRIVGHEGKIEIVSLNFERSQDKKKMIVHIMKQVDELSPHLQKAMLDGEPLSAAQFTSIRRNDRGEIETGLTFDFTNGFITSFQQSASTGPIAYEVITMEFILKEEDEKKRAETK
jgi:type VI protein secretion system component Hcp